MRGAKTALQTYIYIYSVTLNTKFRYYNPAVQFFYYGQKVVQRLITIIKELFIELFTK